jgi:hypothetical protein
MRGRKSSGEVVIPIPHKTLRSDDLAPWQNCCIQPGHGTIGVLKNKNVTEDHLSVGSILFEPQQAGCLQVPWHHKTALD